MPNNCRRRLESRVETSHNRGGGVDVRTASWSWLVASILLFGAGGCGWSSSASPSPSPLTLPASFPGVGQISLKSSQSLLEGRVAAMVADNHQLALLVQWTNVPGASTLMRLNPISENLVVAPGPVSASAVGLGSGGQLSWIGSGNQWHGPKGTISLEPDAAGTWRIFPLGYDIWAVVEQLQANQWRYWLIKNNAIEQTGTEIGTPISISEAPDGALMAAVSNPDRIVWLQAGGKKTSFALPGVPVQLGVQAGQMVCLVSTVASSPKLANLLWTQNIKTGDHHLIAVPAAWTPSATHVTPWVGGSTNFLWNNNHSVILSLWDPVSSQVALAMVNLSTRTSRILPQSLFRASLSQNQEPVFPAAKGPGQSIAVGNGFSLAWYLPTKPQLPS